MIKIIPAIDLLGGRCVRLTKGDYATKKEYSDDSAFVARKFCEAGLRWIHVVDLDGAKADFPANLDSVRRISDVIKAHLAQEGCIEPESSIEPGGCIEPECCIAREGCIVPEGGIEFGGGVKNRAALEAAFSAGAASVICGSVAVSEPETYAEWLKAYGGGRIVLGADVRDGFVSVKGWTEESRLTCAGLVERFLPYGLKRVIVTDISKDGGLCGVDADFYSRFQKRFPSVEVTVSGGISSMADIEALDAAGLKSVIVGKAYYEGRITLEEMASKSK